MIEFADGRYRVQGPLTLDTVQGGLEEGRRLFGNADADIRVDLAGVTEVDSSGVALLLAWTRDAAARGRSVAFEHLPNNMAALIALYEVEDLLAASVK